MYSGYDKLVAGGGLVTVFAPDDEAFATFLAKKYSAQDVSEVPVSDLSGLIGYQKEDGKKVVLFFR